MATFLGAVFVPFAAALAGGLLLHRPGRVILAGVVVVPAAWFLIAWGTAGSERGDCSDCGEYLGRYWEPWTAAALAVFGIVAWALGAGIGAWASSRARLRARRPA